jgi:predicted RNase H-like nuclease
MPGVLPQEPIGRQDVTSPAVVFAVEKLPRRAIMRSMNVLGVDGCRAGWIAVLLEDGVYRKAFFFQDFASLYRTATDARIVAVDIPIGLPERGPREADLAAKKVLKERASSIFLAPPRIVLEQPNYTKARQAAKEIGWGVSAQAYNLRKKIFEVEAFAAKDDRIHEVHPEISFREMAGGSRLAKKTTWKGLHERIRLLSGCGIDLPMDVGPAGESARSDDIVDAAAAAWTAERLARGRAQSIPDELGELAGNRLIAIWY